MVNMLFAYIRKGLLIQFFLFITINIFPQNGKNIAGYPNREESAHLFENFVNPPKGYGEVAFYWWQGDTLKKERLLDQLNMLQHSKVTSLQINYAHDDFFDSETGARPHYKTVPDVMSDDWWALVKWFTKEAKERGMSVSLSDYSLGIGQKSYFDAAMNKYPDVRGYLLKNHTKILEKNVEWILPDDMVSLSAYKLDGNNMIISGSLLDLSDQIKNNKIKCKLPVGKWKVYAIYKEKQQWSYDPMNPNSGKGIIELFYDEFNNRIPNEMGHGLNFFFSDELNFKLKGKVWNNQFREEFKKRKGYDICPELVALWDNIGPRTTKIRLDYNDVYVSLSEQNYFKPIFDYNQKNGMILGCDHGGRGYMLDEFGDYFRTQRWNQGPGSDQPFLAKSIIKAKVASSIANMYGRPRVWLEGFYGSGWSTNTAALADALYANMAMGYNLFTLHGLYYTTLGRWWEWAPPCNHFRMPYWAHMSNFLSASERLSFLLSQGYHCADVAILYPVEAVVADAEEGKRSVGSAFSSGEYLYKNGVDFDFMDYQSLQNASIENRKLKVGEMAFSVVIVPSMKAITHASLLKLIEFAKAGGLVINIGSTAVATELNGETEEVKQLVAEIFQNSTAYKVRSIDEGLAVIDRKVGRDFKIENIVDSKSFPYINHRKMGNYNVYAVYNVSKGNKCFFRTKGRVELWNQDTGKVYELKNIEETDNGTIVEMPLDKENMQLIVFSPDGQKNIENFKYSKIPSKVIPLGKEWDFELKPILNNKWGDYYIPASDELVGAWIEKLQYTRGNKRPSENAKWEDAICTFGPQFLEKGPIKQALSYSDLKKSLVQKNGWKEYRFSWRFGVEGDCGRQGYHGLKGKIENNLIRLGKLETLPWSGTMVRKPEPKGHYYYLYTSINAPYSGVYQVLQGEISPKKVFVDGIEENIKPTIQLSKGKHELILEYDNVCITNFLLQLQDGATHNATKINEDFPLSTRWNGDDSVLKFDAYADNCDNVGWYRFQCAPGLETLKFNAWGKIKVFVGTKECSLVNEGTTWDGAGKYIVRMPQLVTVPEAIYIRIEHEYGYYGGGAFESPIKQYCKKGQFKIGDWSQLSGLSNYSGGVIYSKAINITSDLLTKNIELDLKNVVSTAEVFVNGKSVGVRYTAPWTFDLTDCFKKGINKIEVLVYNTLGNLYTTIPTVYKKETISGILEEPQLNVW